MSARLKFLQPLLLIVVAYGLYWPSLHYPTFFDDTNYFELGVLQQVFLDGFAFAPRWLPYFLTAWVDLLFEDHLYVQRCLNVGLHLATAFALQGFVRQVADHVAPHPVNGRAAWAAALLFLLHPLAVYAVGYLIQRTIVMATLFGVLALGSYFDGLIKGKRAYFVFSAFFYLLSSFSKEHAVLIPAVALALTPLAGPVDRNVWRRLALPFALYLPVGVLVALKAGAIVGETYEPYAGSLVGLHGGGSQFELWGLSILTQVALFFKYLGLMLLPYPGWMSIDMRVPFARDYGQAQYWFYMLVLAAYLWASLLWLRARGRRGMLGFALLAPLILFGVEFTAVRIQEPFVLYRSYLWLAPVFFLVPVIAQSLPEKLFVPIILAVAVAFGVASADRLGSFASTYALWDDAAKKLTDPRALGAARIYTNRGSILLKRGDSGAAIVDFTNALRADPGYKDARRGRAFAYLKQGQYDGALAEADALVALDPSDGEGYLARGKIHRARGDRERANVDFEYGCARTQRPEICTALFLGPAANRNPR